MISALSIPLQIHACGPEVVVAELALDDHERDAFVRHLASVSVPELVGREATSDASFSGCVM
jgi:hypothetical protein